MLYFNTNVGATLGASDTGRLIDCRLPRLRTLPNAEVRFATMEGRPLRGSRSRGDGSVMVAGLVGVAAGSRVMMTAYDGEKVEARVVRTMAPG